MTNDDPLTGDELGRSYAEMLGDQAWETEAPEAPPVPATEPAAPPAPLTAPRARQVIRGMTADQFTQTIDELNRAYRRQNRPYLIQPRDQGYVLALRPKFRGVMEKVFGGAREARLSTQAIDVLALVAYRQPATKAEVDSLRGAESGPLLRQLVRRGLIQVMHRADADRKEVSYGTTPRFLELFGLHNLDDLPKTQEFV